MLGNPTKNVSQKTICMKLFASHFEQWKFSLCHNSFLWLKNVAIQNYKEFDHVELTEIAKLKLAK